MYYTVDIPVKPYVKDYFTGLYSSPVIASKNNIIGLTLEPYLEKPPLKPAVSPSENSMIVEISWAAQNRGYKDVRVYNYISPANAKILANALEKLFWWNFNAYLDSNAINPHKMQVKVLIYNYFDKYKINPDNASYEMFKKRYYRHIKSFGHSSQN